MHGLQSDNLLPKQLPFLFPAKIYRAEVKVVDHRFELIDLDRTIKHQPLIVLVMRYLADIANLWAVG